MRKHYILLTISLVIFVTLVYSLPGMACSSYVIYTPKEVVYGMNFDSSIDCDTLYMIGKLPSGKKYFLQCFQGSATEYYPQVGMNEDGLYGELHSVEAVAYTGKDKKPTLSIALALEEVLKGKKTLAETEAYLNSYRLVNPTGWGLHTLYADKSGHAGIFEITATGNVEIKNDKNFMIMTNFYLSNNIGETYKTMHGYGADRYRKLYETVQKNLNKLTIDTCFSMLQEVANGSTRSTTIFFPLKQEIYLMSDDISRIWKISLKDETIETYRGFRVRKKVKLTSEGIKGEELSKWK